MPKICPVCNTAYPDANAFCPVDGSTLRAAELDGDLIGSVVADRYLVTDLLGEGGMGKVYLARHVRLPQQAAIKVLRKELVRDPSAVSRFNREATSASRIEDDHVARVYDFGETSDGLVYLAMEYVPGRTLRALIHEEGPLRARRVSSLVKQIADGLDAAHRLGIVHRDLKPDNVLVVTGAKGRDRVKVVDFGIAKAFGTQDAGLTKTGFVVGTPEFMSPEQLLGESVDPRSDVYALALLAYQCLTGSLPFESSTPEQMLTSRLTNPPRPLLDVRPDVTWPPAVQAVFDDALARDVSRRPESAGEFAERLEGALAEAWTQPGARPTASAPAARPATPRAPAAPTPPPAPTRSKLPMVLGAIAVAAVAVFAYLATRHGAQDEAVTHAPPATAVDSTKPAAPRPESTAAVAPPAARDTARARTPRDTPRESAPTGDRRESSTAESDRQYAARLVLDSLTNVLHRGNSDAATARAVAAAIRDLLPRLARDARAAAHIRLVEASALAGDLAGACAALRAARAAAGTAAERAEVRKYDEQLGCG
ncbi:protein kinase [Gemmatirosa kalamazoonensis]|uniref:non-specific serine/threonine protein kinase n=1 Tax=Gemmatirosa kalamazoonensis TaxID=861299 RepID=W0RQ11_9BACT|nr:serine/threonine-protein kinase [Gemmatirosa kalamazoonensis]AHG91603.1 protein kinase [Gemmatirosa kalamazoonensis]